MNIPDEFQTVGLTEQALNRAEKDLSKKSLNSLWESNKAECKYILYLKPEIQPTQGDILTAEWDITLSCSHSFSLNQHTFFTDLWSAYMG